MLHLLEEIIELVAEYTIVILETIGIAIIVFGAIKSLYHFFHSKLCVSDRKPKLELANAIALALEFMLGAEILKTLISTNIEDLAFLAIVIVLRIVITLLIHYEISVEMKEEKEEALMENEQKLMEMGVTRIQEKIDYIKKHLHGEINK